MMFRRSNLDLLLVNPVSSRREERRLLNTGNTKKGDFLSQEVVRSKTLYDEVQRYLHTTSVCLIQTYLRSKKIDRYNLIVV